MNFFDKEMLIGYLLFTATMIVFFLVFTIVVGILFYLPAILIESIIRYLLLSEALYRIAKLKNNPHAWYAFIPWLRIYLQLSLPEGSSKFIVQFKDRKSLALTLTIIEIALDVIPLGGILDYFAGIVVTILYLKRIYDFIEMLDKKNAILFTVLAFILGYFAPVYTVLLWAEYFSLAKGGRLNG